MKYRLLIFSLILSGCSHHKTFELPEGETAVIKKFKNAQYPQSSWPKSNVLTCIVSSEPDNLHPTNGNSSPRSEIFNYIHRTLIYIDYSNQQLIPGLVKSLPVISKDGLIYSYSLRNDLRWDDGKSVVAEDVLFTAKAYKCPLTNDWAVRTYWNNVKDVLIDPNDVLSFRIVMKKVSIQNISFLTSFPVLERVFYDKNNVLGNYSFTQFDDSAFQTSSKSDLNLWAGEFNSEKYGHNPAIINGLGMYKVVKWEYGQYIVLDRKKNHWSHSSKDYHEVSFPEKIIFKLNKDEASQSFEIRAQSIDASSNISVNNFINLNQDENFRNNYNSAMMPTFSYTYVCFNEKPKLPQRIPFFTDVKVRRAFALLTPIDNIIKLQYKEYSNNCRRMISMVSPMKKEFNNKLLSVPLDIEKAASLLKEAGWSDSNNNGILDKEINGKTTPLSIELNYISSSAEWKGIAQLIAESFLKVGVQINPIPLDLKLFIEKAKAHDFDLILGSFAAPGLDEDYSQLWHSTSWSNHGSNYSGFGTAKSDSLIESIKSAIDDSVRSSLSKELQQLIYDDQPFIFLYSVLRRNIIHKRFGNQMLFSERPGILYNMLQLLSTNEGVKVNDDVNP